MHAQCMYILLVFFATYFVGSPLWSLEQCWCV